MHIAITGPVATENISQFLNGDTTALPSGYTGAPFMATLIGELLKRGHTVSAFTLSSDIPLNSDEVIAHGENFSMHYIPMRPKAWPFNGWRLGRILDLYYCHSVFVWSWSILWLDVSFRLIV